MFLSTNEGSLSSGKSIQPLGKMPSIDTSCSPHRKLALELVVAQKKYYSTVTKHGARNERVHSKDFLTNKMKASIFHFREQRPTEVRPLFITSVGRGIIKVTEV